MSYAQFSHALLQIRRLPETMPVAAPNGAVLKAADLRETTMSCGGNRAETLLSMPQPSREMTWETRHCASKGGVSERNVTIRIG